MGQGRQNLYVVAISDLNRFFPFKIILVNLAEKSNWPHGSTAMSNLSFYVCPYFSSKGFDLIYIDCLLFGREVHFPWVPLGTVWYLCRLHLSCPYQNSCNRWMWLSIKQQMRLFLLSWVVPWKYLITSSTARVCWNCKGPPHYSRLIFFFTTFLLFDICNAYFVLVIADTNRIIILICSFELYLLAIIFLFCGVCVILVWNCILQSFTWLPPLCHSYAFVWTFIMRQIWCLHDALLRLGTLLYFMVVRWNSLDIGSCEVPKYSIARYFHKVVCITPRQYFINEYLSYVVNTIIDSGVNSLLLPFVV